MTHGHKDFGHPVRIICQWLGHGKAREGRETNLGGLGDKVFEGEGRLSILMLLLKLLGYVNHFGVAVFVKIWGKRRGSLRSPKNVGLFVQWDDTLKVEARERQKKGLVDKHQNQGEEYKG